MQRLDVSGAVQYIYIYICVYVCVCVCVSLGGKGLIVISVTQILVALYKPKKYVKMYIFY
jgi:hypothetical protein